MLQLCSFLYINAADNSYSVLVNSHSCLHGCRPFHFNNVQVFLFYLRDLSFVDVNPQHLTHDEPRVKTTSVFRLVLLQATTSRSQPSFPWEPPNWSLFKFAESVMESKWRRGCERERERISQSGCDSDRHALHPHLSICGLLMRLWRGGGVERWRGRHYDTVTL